jgi:aldose 1-epimerase
VELLELRSGDWVAQVLPEMAMNMISLRYKDKPVLHEPENLEAVPNDPFIYGIPLLLPPNRLENNSFRFEGKNYTIPYSDTQDRFRMHGCVRNAPFSVVSSDDRHVLGRFFVDKDRYPFPLEITVAYELSERGMRSVHTVSNTGTGKVPFAIGFHTAFSLPDYFCVSIDKAWTVDPETGLPATLTELNEEQRRYKDGTSPKGISVDGFFTDSGAHTAHIGEFTYSVSDNFTNWVIWNMGGRKPLLCIEPQSAPVNGLNMESQYSVLESGQKENFITEITCA